jgi:hypothetical protein
MLLKNEKLGMKMPLCRKLLEIFRELEAGKRQFRQKNYEELVATSNSSRRGRLWETVRNASTLNFETQTRGVRRVCCSA